MRSISRHLSFTVLKHASQTPPKPSGPLQGWKEWLGEAFPQYISIWRGNKTKTSAMAVWTFSGDMLGVLHVLYLFTFIYFLTDWEGMCVMLQTQLLLMWRAHTGLRFLTAGRARLLSAWSVLCFLDRSWPHWRVFVVTCCCISTLVPREHQSLRSDNLPWKKLLLSQQWPGTSKPRGEILQLRDRNRLSLACNMGLNKHFISNMTCKEGCLSFLLGEY